MSYLPTLTAVVAGAGIGIVGAIRAIRGKTSAKDVLFWSTFFAALTGAFVIWQLMMQSMLGDSSKYFLPTLESKAQRNILLYYAVLSGALAAMFTAGLAVIASRVNKA